MQCVAMSLHELTECFWAAPVSRMMGGYPIAVSGQIEGAQEHVSGPWSDNGQQRCSLPEPMFTGRAILSVFE